MRQRARVALIWTLYTITYEAMVNCQNVDCRREQMREKYKEHIDTNVSVMT